MRVDLMSAAVNERMEEIFDALDGASDSGLHQGTKVSVGDCLAACRLSLKSCALK
jgi:hypothetical protein